MNYSRHSSALKQRGVPFVPIAVERGKPFTFQHKAIDQAFPNGTFRGYFALTPNSPELGFFGISIGPASDVVLGDLLSELKACNPTAPCGYELTDKVSARNITLSGSATLFNSVTRSEDLGEPVTIPYWARHVLSQTLYWAGTITITETEL